MGAQLASKSDSSQQAAAVKAFEALGVCTQLSEAAAGLGWKHPTEIQSQAIPHVLQGAPPQAGQAGARMPQPLMAATTTRTPSVLHLKTLTHSVPPLPCRHAGQDIIGLAQTGSGKTGAFALPILQVCVAWGAGLG